MSRSDAQKWVNYLFASLTPQQRTKVRKTYREYRKPVSSQHVEHKATLADTRKTGWVTQARAEALWELQDLTLTPTAQYEERN